MKTVSILSLVLLSGCGSSSKSAPLEAVEHLTTISFETSKRIDLGSKIKHKIMFIFSGYQ